MISSNAIASSSNSPLSLKRDAPFLGWSKHSPEQKADQLSMLSTALTVLPKQAREHMIHAFTQKNNLPREFLLDLSACQDNPHIVIGLKSQLIDELDRLSSVIASGDVSNLKNEIARTFHLLNGKFTLAEIINQPFYYEKAGKQTCLLNIALDCTAQSQKPSQKALFSNCIIDLLHLGADPNLDFGYHGKSWSKREIPPIIKAIRLSNSSIENQSFFNPIAIKMFQEFGACVNATHDNPTPLLEAYNKKINGIKNPELFEFLLNHPDINPFQYDTIKTSYFRIDIPAFDAIPHRACQLLCLIDSDLKNPNSNKAAIKIGFFNPLFDLMHKKLSEKAAAVTSSPD